MSKFFSLFCFVLELIFFSQVASASDEELIAWWKFEESKDKTTLDSKSGVQDNIYGNFHIVKGVTENALQLDGFSAYVVRKAAESINVSGAFSVQAWVALGAYPWNWCPIVSQDKEPEMGYYFGIGSEGQICLNLSLDGAWKTATSNKSLPLAEWVHIAGVYDPKVGVTLYVNGEPAGVTKVQGSFTPASGVDLFIGKHRNLSRVSHPAWGSGQADAKIFLDAVIDELKIYNRSLKANELKQYFTQNKPTLAPPISKRFLPAGPEGPGEFGAYYTRLKYKEGWDRIWRVGDHADVVVRFDEAAYRLVLWRGTSYLPSWVTGNGIWYCNQHVEVRASRDGGNGTGEPFNDKQCRYNHVRIIENTGARVVIHWRYANADINYYIPYVDENTGWGEWTDEYHYIYPDGIAIREATVHSTIRDMWREWQEAILIIPPGNRPEDVIDLRAVEIANMQGESLKPSWEEKVPVLKNRLANPNIQIINVKAENKPFLIVPPKNSHMDAYIYSVRPEISKFPWYNHWPVAEVPTDGRNAVVTDRASHACFSHLFWDEYAVTETTMSKIMLHGMTNKSAVELIPLANAWLHAPELKNVSRGYSSEGYKTIERAYHLENKNSTSPAPLSFEIAASEDQPLNNPCFVIKNWGKKEARLQINGRTIDQGKNFRIGHRLSFEGAKDLIVWVKVESFEPVKFSLSASE